MRPDLAISDTFASRGGVSRSILPERVVSSHSKYTCDHYHRLGITIRFDIDQLSDRNDKYIVGVVGGIPEKRWEHTDGLKVDRPDDIVVGK